MNLGQKLKGKFTPRSQKYFVVGMAQNSSRDTYRMYNPVTRCVVETRDVKWADWHGKLKHDPTHDLEDFDDVVDESASIITDTNATHGGRKDSVETTKSKSQVGAKVEDLESAVVTPVKSTKEENDAPPTPIKSVGSKIEDLESAYDDLKEQLNEAFKELTSIKEEDEVDDEELV